MTYRKAATCKVKAPLSVPACLSLSPFYRARVPDVASAVEGNTGTVVVMGGEKGVVDVRCTY